MPSPDDPRRRARARLASVVVIALFLCAASPASGQDGVWVSFHGGTQQADALDLVERDSEWVVTPRGQRQLLSDDIGLQVINDYKLLPDGSNLLAGIGGRGALITDESGEVEFSFASPDSYPRASSASVMIYAAPGDPGRILMSESNTSRLLLFEPDERRIVWQAGFQLPGAVGLFADAIVLRNSRVAAGISYTNLGVSAIDIIDFTPGPTSTVLRRITNQQHADGPSNQITVEGLHPINDLLGLPNGNLLVATDERLYELTVDGVVEWVAQISGREGLQGDLSSVSLMPSGRVAVAMLQPGQWTSPHLNHRVHWLERGPLENGDVEIVASSEALRRAPAGIETKGGHGGSGTFGYRPGLDDQSAGSLSELGVARPLSFSAETYSPRDSVAGSILVQNEGDEAVYIARLHVRAVPGECGASASGSPVELFDARFIQLQPDALFDLRGGLAVDEGLGLGRWCAQTYASDGDTEPIRIGEPAYFEVVERSADGDGTVVVRDVGFWGADAFDGGQETSPPVEPPGGGCCSHTVNDKPPLRSALLCILVLAAGLIARRRTHH